MTREIRAAHFLASNMINVDRLDKEIDHISLIVKEVELAMVLEDNKTTKNGLASALGQLKAARTWLVKIQKEEHGSN